MLNRTEDYLTSTIKTIPREFQSFLDVILWKNEAANLAVLLKIFVSTFE